jgi:hypothetical protein
MEYSESQFDQLELMLETGRTIDQAKQLTDEELVEIISSHLPFFETDTDIDGLISVFFHNGQLTKLERLRLEGAFTILFSPYAFAENGNVVGTVLR